jgi:hypothetical protein
VCIKWLLGQPHNKESTRMANMNMMSQALQPKAQCKHAAPKKRQAAAPDAISPLHVVAALMMALDDDAAVQEDKIASGGAGAARAGVGSGDLATVVSRVTANAQKRLCPCGQGRC